LLLTFRAQAEKESSLPPEPWSLTARWIAPIDRAPLERGVVVIAGERIAAIEPRGTRRPDLELGDAAVLPGLVNAHTHLDLSGFAAPIPFTGDFTEWLRAVIAHRRSRTPEQVLRDIQAGLAECLRCGTTLIGDIAGQGLSWNELAAAPMRAVVYYELLGLTRERERRVWMDMLKWRRTHPGTSNCRPGLSPHAPYSARLSLLRAAAWNSGPFAVHLAETLAEGQLLEDHSGPFVPFLQELGVWDPEGLAKNFNEILWRSSRASSIAFVHANHLPTDSVIPAHAAVVYCPRTHAHFRHPPHPIAEFLARGVRVALGTDSRASNPDLDVLAEARYLHRIRPELAPDAILRSATLSGAEALGWADETGSLTTGKSADLVVLPLPHDDDRDPCRLVLESERPATGVLWRGRWTRALNSDGAPLSSNKDSPSEQSR
jgi:cytosine/adenosine deaminase-related metal-dependent hydrolase